MDDSESTIKAFFGAYEKRFNDAVKDPPTVDAEGVVKSFAKYFVGANPGGVLWLLKQAAIPLG